jgi:hypothetical protein
MMGDEGQGGMDGGGFDGRGGEAREREREDGLAGIDSTQDDCVSHAFNLKPNHHQYSDNPRTDHRR